MAYQGLEATIPFGQYGIMSDMSPTDIPPNALINAHDIVLHPGYIEKAPGSSKYNSSALGSGTNIVAGIDWWPTITKQRMIVAGSNGSIYRDIGDGLFSGGTAIKTGLSGLTNRCMFVEGGAETASESKKLFFISGNNQIQVLEGDGTSFAAIATPSADWTTPNFPKCGVIHRNRLWVFMGQRSYASSTADHEDFVNNDLADVVYPGEGGEIISAKVFKGRLFCFKQGGFVYYLNDTSADNTEWYWQKLDSGVTIASPNSVQQVMNDLVIGTASGSLVSGTAVEALGDIKSADIFSAAKVEQFMRNGTSNSGLEEMVSTYYAEKKQGYFTYRTMYTNYNNAHVTLDMAAGIPRILFNKKDVITCFFERQDINKVRRICYGSTDGYVYLMDRADRDVGGNAFTSTFQTPHIDFRHLDPKIASRKKIFDWMQVEFIECGDWNISCDVIIDGDIIETLSIPMANRNDFLDAFTLDSSRLASEETQRSVVQPLHGSGRTLSLKFYNSGLRQNFKIASFTVGFRLGAQDAPRLSTGPS